jgi:demethylsterigmatocystin 6-O-methyltransferase
VEENKNTALQRAHNTELPFFDWMLTQPKTLAHFNAYMSVHHTGKRSWLEVYDLKDKIAGLKPEQVFFVDVGGGRGQQSIALRKKYPDTKLKIIMEDTKETVAQAMPMADIKILAQDIFDPQAITGEQLSFPFFFDRMTTNQ